VNEDLLCVLCRAPAFVPFEHSSCSRMICRACLDNEQVNQCSCGSSIDLSNGVEKCPTLKPVTVGVVLRLLDDLKVSCKQCNNFVGTRNMFMEHHCTNGCSAR
jgi:hypothetical protein